MSLLASSLKATSLSLPGMISLVDPTWRKHSTIWSSSGSRLAMEKYLAAGDGVVVSLICSNPSETNTTRANTSAASSSYQPTSTLITCLVLAASLESLQQNHHFCLSLLLCHHNGIRRPFPGFPRSISLPEAIHHLIIERRPRAAARQSGVHPSLVGSFTLTLESFSSRRAQEVRPLRQAHRKGVSPKAFFKLTSVRGWARRIKAMEPWPFIQAASRAVEPSSSALLTLTSRSGLLKRISFTSFTSPSQAAHQNLLSIGSDTKRRGRGRRRSFGGEEKERE